MARAKEGKRTPGVLVLKKSPSDHMVSISEEQSTRKHHLKSGSLPEIRLHHKGSNDFAAPIEEEKKQCSAGVF